MVRRVLSIALIFVGLAPISWALVIMTSDPRRAALLGAIGAIGIGLNAAVAARTRIAVRFPLRFMSCGVLLVVAGGVMAYRQWLGDVYLDRLPEGDERSRAEAATALVNLLWIAGSLGYLLVTTLSLPAAKEPPPADPDESKIPAKSELERRLQKARHYKSRRQRGQSSR